LNRLQNKLGIGLFFVMLVALACIFISSPQAKAATLPTADVSDVTWYNADQNVTLTTGGGETIYYTIDGSVPTMGSSVYTNPIAITGNSGSKTTITLKFFSYNSGDLSSSVIVTRNYVIDKISPSVTDNRPDNNWYNADIPITFNLLDSTLGDSVKVYYTTDGSNPTTSSAQSGAIMVTGASNAKTGVTLKYMAVDKAGNSTAVVTRNYTIDKIAPTVAADVADGCYRIDQTMTLSAADATPGDTTQIYYSLGVASGKTVPVVATPTTASSLYSSPINLTALVSGENTYVIKIMTRDIAGNQTVITRTVCIDKINPQVMIDTISGWYNTDKTVNLSPSEVQTTIYYEIVSANGKVAQTAPIPSGTSTVYSGTIPLTVPADSEKTYTINFIAKDCAGNWSQVYTQIYHMDKILPTITDMTLRGGEFKDPQKVNVTTSESTANIFYTTDGSDPRVGGNLYGGVIVLDKLVTAFPLKVVVIDYAGNQSPISTDDYLIDPYPPTVSFSTPGNGASNVILNPLNRPIILTFSKSILTDTNYDGITLKDGNNVVKPFSRSSSSICFKY
jgi:hypothetical protein